MKCETPKQDQSYHIISFGRKPENLLLAIEKGTLGSASANISKYLKPNSLIFFHCCSSLVGIGVVKSEYFFSEEKVWKNKKMAGHMGDKNVISKNLKVVKMAGDLVFVLGSAPGAEGALVRILKV